MTSLIHLIPGDPIDLMLGETASTVDREALRRPVGILIGERLPATAALARAKGLVEWVVVVKHALGNALIPLVTLIGLQGGDVAVGGGDYRDDFCLAGVGRSHHSGHSAAGLSGGAGVCIGHRALTYVVANMIAGVVYAALDPRIRFESQ